MDLYWTIEAKIPMTPQMVPMADTILTIGVVVVTKEGVFFWPGIALWQTTRILFVEILTAGQVKCATIAR